VQDTIGLVLSGGGGERLSVLTAERAVSALPFGGKYRIIDFILSNCSHSGVPRVGVLTQHAPTSLHDHIGSGRSWDYDRREGGVTILQPYMTREHAGWYRGTADALAQNWDAVMARRVEQVLVLSGDHVYKMDYRAMRLTHRIRKAAVTLAVKEVSREDAHRFGMVTLDGDRVAKLEEKPEVTDTRLASMGIYLFEPEILAEALRGHPVDLVMDVLRPLIDAGAPVIAHRFDGYWEDVGTVATYYRASLDVLSPEPRIGLYDSGWPILTRDEERPPVLMLPGADIEGSLVANGCRVAGRVRNSILFPGVTVERGAEVEDAVVFQDTLVGHGARISRAIVDKYVRVGGGAIVGDGEVVHDPALAWLDGLTLVGKDALIPDGARVGRQVVIGLGAGPEDFPGNVVTANTRVADRSVYAGLA
jgi:glucose-1-phosphate adenylyltransferase